MSDRRDLPINRAAREQLHRELDALLDRAMRGGVHGEAALRMAVHDGTVADYERTLSERGRIKKLTG